MKNHSVELNYLELSNKNISYMGADGLALPSGGDYFDGVFTRELPGGCSVSVLTLGISKTKTSVFTSQIEVGA